MADIGGPRNDAINAPKLSVCFAPMREGHREPDEKAHASEKTKYVFTTRKAEGEEGGQGGEGEGLIIFITG